MSNAIVQQATNNGALNAEHYQSFEMAKANDDVLATGTLKELINYQAQVRAMLEYTHKLVSTMSSWDEFTSSRAETLATEQAAANLNVFIDQRMGELVAALPTKQGKRSDITSLPTGNEVTKTEALKDAGLTPKTASQLEQLAANPEVVQIVIDKATEEGKVVSRSQVLKAIKEREEAEKERDAARHAEHMMHREVESMRQALAERPEPEVIEREVVREVESPESKRRIAELERENKQLSDEYQQMWAKKRDADKRLQQANELLGENERNNNARRDVEQLTIATNSYLRNYGGKAWAFDQFDRVDEPTQQEFIKAITNLTAFAQNLTALIQDRKQLGA